MVALLADTFDGHHRATLRDRVNELVVMRRMHEHHSTEDVPNERETERDERRAEHNARWVLEERRATHQHVEHGDQDADDESTDGPRQRVGVTTDLASELRIACDKRDVVWPYAIPVKPSKGRKRVRGSMEHADKGARM